MARIEHKFKVGDRVKCIQVPNYGQYQCALHVKAVVRKVYASGIYTEDNINTQGYGDEACYRNEYFALDKKSMSFKNIEILADKDFTRVHRRRYKRR